MMHTHNTTMTTPTDIIAKQTMQERGIMYVSNSDMCMIDKYHAPSGLGCHVDSSMIDDVYPRYMMMLLDGRCLSLAYHALSGLSLAALKGCDHVANQ